MTMRLVLFLVVAASADPCTVAAQHAGHGVHPPMPLKRYVFRCSFEREGKPVVVEVPIELSMPTAPADLDQSVRLSEASDPVRLVRYLPRAVMQQEVLPDDGPGAAPAVMLVIEGPKQRYDRWLIADDAKRNRLMSFIGNWRYMSVETKKLRDELYEQFKTELTREPQLIVRSADGDGVWFLPAKAGATKSLDAPRCTLRVKRFFPHFAMDRKSEKPVNQSDRRENPAVLVEVECDGRKSEQWVFAKFPDYKTGESRDLPVSLALDCPVEQPRTTPGFVLVTVGRRNHEVWKRYEGKITTGKLDVGQSVAVSGSQYSFSLESFIPAGRLVESFGESEESGARPALKIETTSAEGRVATLWLELGSPRTITTKQGRMVVVFGPGQESAPGGHP